MSKRKIHPQSLANLKHEGRPLAVGEPKKERVVTVSQTGWNGVKLMALDLECRGVSELLEKLGRRKFVLVPVSEQEGFEEQFQDSFD